MGIVKLDKRHYLQFEDSKTPTIEMIDTMLGQKHPKGHKLAGQQKAPVSLGCYSSILAALKDYANIKTARSKDMDVQQLIKALSGFYEKFNDVSWLDLAKEASK